MSEFVRLIALAIVTFFVAIVVTILSNPELTRLMAVKAGLLQRQDPRLESWMADPLAPGDGILPIHLPHQDEWSGLTGFPSTTEIRFPLPEDLPMLGGQLQLLLDMQLAQAGNGLMTVSINGTERDAIVLDPGIRQRELIYDLSPEDLSGRYLIVNLAGDGTTDQGQICPTNAVDLGVAIEVNKASQLMLRYDGKLLLPETTLTIRPEPLNLSLSDTAGATAIPVWVAQYLTRMNASTKLSTDPEAVSLTGDATPLAFFDRKKNIDVSTSPEGIAHLASLRGGSLPEIYKHSWPVSVATFGVDTQTRPFRGSRRWEFSYRLADMPEGIAPDVLNITLRANQLQEPHNWNMRVTLNGTLIHSSREDSRKGEIRRSIPLSAALQGLTNEIEVTLIDPTPKTGVCQTGADAAAQLTEESNLGHDKIPDPANPRESVIRKLAESGSASLTSPTDLSLPAARQASDLLGLILPLTTHISTDLTTDQPRIAILNSSFAILQVNRDTTRYLVYRSDHDNDTVTVERLSEAASDHIPSNDDTALLIEW